MRQLLSDLAQTEGIDVHVIEARAKTVDSFAEKCARPGKTYSNPLQEITDLCGVRVILYYQADVDQFCAAARKQFAVDDEHSVDKRSELKPDQFGYISVHLIARLGDNRKSLPEWVIYKEIKFEIQVRTVLQHAWASISHALQYKSEAETPRQFVRQLTRVASLLELADEQFADVRQKTATLSSEVETSLSEGRLDLSINSVTVTQYLETSPLCKKISEAAWASGFGYMEMTPPSQLIEVCDVLGISNISQVDAILTKFAPRAKKFFESFADQESEGGTLDIDDYTGDMDHWCTVAVVSENPDERIKRRMAAKGMWGEEYFGHIVDAVKSLRRKK